MNDSKPYEDKQFITLYEVSRRINSILDPDKLQREIVSLLTNTLEVDQGMIFLKNPSSGELEITYSTIENSDELKEAANYSKTIVSESAESGREFISEDAQNETMFKKYESVHFLNIQSVMCVPLKLREETIGAIYVDTRTRSRRFSMKDLLFLKAFANLAAVAVDNARLHKTLKDERDYLKREVSRQYRYSGIIGGGPAMKKVFHLMDRAVESDITVYIQGETGTGKELAARAIHYNSERKDGKFVGVDCGALPESLAESELFGHEKGAFTDARETRKGLFEQASGGTLFLDEINNLSRSLQVKLLRVLQEGEVRRLGGDGNIKVDVRVISASSADLEKEVEKGTFRDDLFFRLNVLSIKLPPLKERREDIPLLAHHLLQKHLEKAGKRIPGIAPDAVELLVNYEWPGNVRELENEIQRVVALSADGESVDAGMLSDKFRDRDSSGLSMQEKVEKLERKMIEDSLRRNGWNKSKTARELGISRSGLHLKLDKYGIDSEGR